MKRYIKSSTYEDELRMKLDFYKSKLDPQSLVKYEKYESMDFNVRQLEVILDGLLNGFDVSIYANPEYNAKWMNVLLKRLKRERASKNSVKLVNQDDKSYATETRDSWEELIRELEYEAEDGIDSLYEQTEAGSKLESIQQEVEDNLGIWLEPSVQAGMGGIWFYSSEDNHTLASNYDYQTFNEDTIDIAISSKNKTEFKKRYKAYLKNILKEYAFED